MTHPEHPEIAVDIAAINAQAAQELYERSIEAARSIVSLVHKATVFYAAKDKDLLETLEILGPAPGETHDLYVLQDMLAAPQDANTFTWCLSLRLRGNNPDTEQAVREGSNELFLYLPVPEKLDIRKDVIPLPTNVYIEHTNPMGDKTRYQIGEMGVSAYSALVDGEEVTEFDLFEERFEYAQAKVDSGLPMLAALEQNLVNMQTVPQRRLVFTEDDVIVVDL
jgi:hypothetical protein